MPSAFDKLFAATATPTLFSAFAVKIEIEGPEAWPHEVDAQIGREIVRRVRMNDGFKLLRTRDVLIRRDAITDSDYNTVAFGGDKWQPNNVLKSLRGALVEGIRYAIVGFDRAPGGMLRLSLERSDPSETSRPNLRGR